MNRPSPLNELHPFGRMFRGASVVLVALALSAVAFSTARAGDLAVTLPEGVRAVWDPAQAQREQTATRERICLNGLWRWQPAEANAEQTPDSELGFLQSPRMLAGHHRLHAEGFADRLCASELEKRPAGRRQGGLVRTGNIDPRRLDWPPHHAPDRVSELLCRGLCGRPEGGRTPFSGRRPGDHGRLPTRRHPSAQPARGGAPIERRDAFLHRQRVGSPGERERGATRIVRRRLAGQQRSRSTDSVRPRHAVRATESTHDRRCP